MSEAQSHRDPHAAKHGKGSKRVYCGNNALAKELASGQAVLGTRSECFRKGVGGGLHATVPPGADKNSSRNGRRHTGNWLTNRYTMETDPPRQGSSPRRSANVSQEVLPSARFRRLSECLGPAAGVQRPTLQGQRREQKVDEQQLGCGHQIRGPKRRNGTTDEQALPRYIA